MKNRLELWRSLDQLEFFTSIVTIGIYSLSGTLIGI